jgi:hypothetical protein
VGWNDDQAVERIAELAGTIDGIASAIEAALDAATPSASAGVAGCVDWPRSSRAAE